MSQEDFEKLSASLLSTSSKFDNKTSERRYISMFGISPTATSIAWEMCRIQLEFPKARPVNLLMALHFLKTYSTEHTARVIFKCDEKTYRKWVWAFAKRISSLDVVSTRSNVKRSLNIVIIDSFWTAN